MNNAQLQSHLRQFPDDLDVLIASDEEGNGFNKLAVVQKEFIEKDGFRYDVIAEEDVEDAGEVEEALVIWP